MTVRPDPWRVIRSVPQPAGPGWVGFVEALRLLQDSATTSAPDDETLTWATERLAEIERRLAPWAVAEGHQHAGRQFDLPGRGSPLFPPFVLDVRARDQISGHVRFRPFFLGANAAAQGGTVAMLFDDLLGQVAHPPGIAVARTAYITVSYKAVTPIDVPLRFDATLDRIEGRKRWATGRLTDGVRLLAAAEGLFVELRPGQP